jgi:hypothetical protein
MREVCDERGVLQVCCRWCSNVRGVAARRGAAACVMHVCATCDASVCSRDHLLVSSVCVHVCMCGVRVWVEM